MSPTELRALAFLRHLASGLLKGSLKIIRGDVSWQDFTDAGQQRIAAGPGIAAFRATLEEIVEADLILHIVDITHPNAAEQAITVNETLVDLKADHIPQLVAMNKIDRLDDPESATEQLAQYPNSLAISAVTGGTGCDRVASLPCRSMVGSKPSHRNRLRRAPESPSQDGRLSFVPRGPADGPESPPGHRDPAANRPE